MKKEQTRALIQEEIRLALGVVREEADERWRGFYTDSAESAAAAVLRDVLDAVLGGAGPVGSDQSRGGVHEVPSPVRGHGKGNCDRCEGRHTFVGETEDDPFAPESADHYATEIRNLISKAEADGYTVWLGGHCEGTGHSLNVGYKSTGTTAPCVWDDSGTTESAGIAGEDDPFSDPEPAPHLCRFKYMDDDNGHSGSFCMVCGKEER